jgi:hypothetical protein
MAETWNCDDNRKRLQLLTEELDRTLPQNDGKTPVFLTKREIKKLSNGNEDVKEALQTLQQKNLIE